VRDPGRRLYRLLHGPALFWVVVLASALPLVLVRHLPLTDLPEHVAAMATIAELLPGGGTGASSYVLALRDSQYLVYHVGGALLTRVTGDALLANRLLLLAVAIAWPLSLRGLLRALGRDERAAVLAPMVFWNRALGVGFLPFVASLPLAVFAVAVVVKQCRTPTMRRMVGLGVLGLVLFYTHVSAWLIVVAIGTSLALAACWTERGTSRFSLEPLLRTAPALVPSAIAALVWWSAGSLAERGRDPSVERLGVLETVNLMPLWTFDMWTGHLDEIAAGAWWLAYAMVVVVGLRHPTDARPRVLAAVIPFAVTALVYIATPSRVGAAGMLNVRLAPLLTLFALVALRFRNDRWGTVPLVLAATATLFNAGAATFEMRRAEREKVGDLDALLSAMKPRTKLALLNFATLSKRTVAWPYPFAGSLHRARGGALVEWSFVELPHWSVHYAPNSAPPPRAYFWVYNPCAFQLKGDTAFYDYVLVQGLVDPFPANAPGHPFVPLAHAGVFTLFERAAGPPNDAPERGPCIPRVGPEISYPAYAP